VQIVLSLLHSKLFRIPMTYGGWRNVSTVIGSIANLVIAAAGAGMLSFPFAVARCGVIGAVAATIAFAALNSFTLAVLAYGYWMHANNVLGQKR